MLSPVRFGESGSPYKTPEPQQGVYGDIQNYGMQQYLPVMEKHELEKPDEKQIDKNLHNWWPRIGAGYATPVPELLASPGKSAAISGLGTGVIGALGGLVFMMRNRGVGALIGGTLGAGIGAVTGFINRRQQNENLTEIMKHLPQGATKRDLLSDPVYQKDRELAATRAAGGGGDIFTGMMMASMLGNGFNARRR
jgi:hypothetical protein